MTQLNLLADTPAARNTDPETSHLAAQDMTRSGRRASQQHAVLAVVDSYPGRTSAELAARSKLDRWAIARRLPELRNAGRVQTGAPKLCSVTGRACMTWWPA